MENHGNTTSEKAILIPNPDMDADDIALFTSSSLLLIVLALSSNIFLIVSLAKKSSVPICNHLIINLCLADGVKSCLHFIIYVISAPVDSWFLGSLMCKFLPGMMNGYQRYSVYILAVLARYHYYAICKPFELVKKKKWKIYVELSVFYVLVVGGSMYNGYEQNHLFYIEDATRCDGMSSINKNADIYTIALAYFFFITITKLKQVYFFSRIAYALWKNARRLGEDRVEASQRLKRNKKAVRTVFVMAIVYDVVVLPTAILKTLALHSIRLSSLRELANVLLLIYCSFNPVFYIWRDEQLKKTVMKFFAKLFCRR